MLDLDEGLVCRQFEAWARKTPEAWAIVSGGGSEVRISYGALNARANQLARCLRSRGAGVDRVVALLADRSIEMIVGILAILKAGSAYLPLSPGGPSERHAHMLREAGVELGLRQAGDPSDLPGSWIDLQDPRLYTGDASDPPPAGDGSSLAYVIYTSGSTGKPKGAMIEHRALANRLLWMQKAYPLAPGDVVLQKTPYVFDVSVWELLWWAISGATVCMMAAGLERFPQAIIEDVERHRVSVAHFVPSMLSVFLGYVKERGEADRLRSWRRVFASGEALHPTHVSSFNEVLGAPNGTRLTNLYGPTEATVDVTAFDCPGVGERLESVPIGKPIDNIEIVILDDQDREAGALVTGELCIVGTGVARGYINNAPATERSFVVHPSRPSARMYRTGDLARWLPDGNIEFQGRRDQQVKIRGMRIELTEIEAAIERDSTVALCAVVVRAASESVASLVAYLVHSREFSLPELEARLGRQLPAYMIPSAFVSLDALPRTTSGKVDRKALQALATGAGSVR